MADKDALGEVITNLATSLDDALMALSADEIASEWYWSWDKHRSIEWNIYNFSDMLEMHKRRWRRWEERHNGCCCVVERVRDKHVMPRVREFLAALAAHLNRGVTG